MCVVNKHISYKFKFKCILNYYFSDENTGNDEYMYYKIVVRGSVILLVIYLCFLNYLVSNVCIR
ncbi:hypothetical protein NIES4071_103740 (plasmid) [Calothrix sp. NIES-4071]|nr:hypothetical protein NIES4071_103740 [Calothrix sp. NIES-4071]BAZ64361.1 hypothetical protein NIES4105_100940 [Calothrix sp. NIES-4105]